MSVNRNVTVPEGTPTATVSQNARQAARGPRAGRPGVFGRLWAMNDVPEVQHARTADGAHIAFQVLGAGPSDLLFLPGASGYIDLV